MTLWPAIAAHIAAATGEPFANPRRRSAGGGCISSTEVLEAGGRRYFVKLNEAARHDMFAAEAEGLAEIAASRSVRVPAPICHGSAAGRAYLVLEHLELDGGAGGSGARLGERLAAMHRHSAERFGWRRDNTVGSTPQVNTESADWLAFWRERRLRFQLELAGRNGYNGGLQRQGDVLMAGLGVFFNDYRPQPSLLHGDLWGGNHGVLRGGEPVIFDPAVYYGDREADIAMTELFGGFGGDFYSAYRSAWPLDAGYRVRRTLYNLYHILNHLNLFGGGYRGQAQRMLDELVSELR
ncbi:MAG TPA: fructosamine kinase family protein [Acidiferrobacterales bacterium]|jgi:fructosamine-3-kinase